jgi:hypothetical protein
MATFYMDLVGGNDSNNGTSFANRWKSFASGATAARTAPGDTIRVMSSPDPTLVGNATWTQNSKTITLASAVTLNITDCETAWTASANVTSTADTAQFKENTRSAKHVIAGAFTTGLCAYLAPLNISGVSISNRASNIVGAASLTLAVNANADEGLQTITLPFSVLYNGVYYSTVTVSSNSWMAFGSTSTNAYSGLSASNPPLPTILIGASDGSWQRVYYGTEGSTFRIRVEGTNATSGTVGSPTWVWEITFDSTAPGTIKIDMASNSYRATPVSGLSDGLGNYIATFASGVSNTGYTLTQTATPLTLDLSGYQQVSFWVYANAAITANTLSLRLCTDTAGATSVHTIPIPSNNQASLWWPVTVDLGTNMNSAIKSVALYQDVDIAAVTVQIDNIIACKAVSSANSLSLTSLIGKVWNLNWAASTTYAANDIRKPTPQNRNGFRYKVTAGGGGNSGSTEPTWPLEIGATITDGALTWACDDLEDTWYGIQSINGTTVKLDNGPQTLGNAGRGYAGTTETVATYKRETIKQAMVGTFTAFNVVQEAGTVGSPITYSGGWNSTDMATQTGETWIDGQHGSYNYGYHLNNVSYLTFDNLNTVRCYQALVGLSTMAGLLIKNCHTNNNLDTAISFGNNGLNAPSSVIGCVADNNGYAGLSLANPMVGVRRASMNSNNQYGVIVTGGTNQNPFQDIAAKNNSQVGFMLSGAAFPIKVARLVTASNASAGVSIGAGVILLNSSITDTTKFSGFNVGSNLSVYSQKDGGVADTHVITTYGGTIISTTDQRHTVPGIAWKFRPTDTYRIASYPLALSVAKIACAANAAVSVSIWTRRDNTNIKGQLILRGGQIAGVPSDIAVSCTPSINTWTQSGNLTFTPTEAGVVELFFEVWDGVGTSNAFWVDDELIS